MRVVRLGQISLNSTHQGAAPSNGQRIGKPMEIRRCPRNGVGERSGKATEAHVLWEGA